MGSVLVIGAGGVGNVVIRKCAAVPEVFERLCLASRTVSKCEQIAAELPRPIETAQVDADDPAQVAALIRKFKPDLVLNVALPYQDLPIMDACLETGTDYLDTANYEPRDEAKFEYKWQWAYHDRFRKKGIMALLGSGFDPGRDEYLLCLCPEAPLRRDSLDRYFRLQRGRPRPSLRDEL